MPSNRDNAGELFAGASNRQAQLFQTTSKAACQPRHVRLDAASADAVEQGKGDLRSGGGGEIVIADVETARIGHQAEIITSTRGLVAGTEIDAEACKIDGVEPLRPALPAIKQTH